MLITFIHMKYAQESHELRGHNEVIRLWLQLKKKTLHYYHNQVALEVLFLTRKVHIGG